MVSDLYSIFQNYVTNSPNEIALSDSQFKFSYEELNSSILEIEGMLREAGVQKGDHVLIRMERRCLLLMTCLSVMKMGISFTPVDPGWPRSRQDYIADDSGAEFVLSDDKTTLEYANKPVDQLHIKSLKADNVSMKEVRAKFSLLVYIIYTSGSSGTPKGVPITMPSFMNYLNWAAKSYLREKGGSVVQTSIGADLTLTSMFLPLMRGRKVHMFASDNQLDFANYLLTKPELAFLKLTPSNLKLLSAMISGHDLISSTEQIVVGGEQLNKNVIDSISDAIGLIVTNEYGPTEATVGCCVYQFKIGDDVPDPVPIGRPIDGMEIHLDLLEHEKNLGEMIISGKGLAHGYLKQKSNSESPFLYVNGQESYRSGDLGFVDEAGNFVYHGRVDRQLKIHGYRVEPAEVESTIERFFSTKQVVVVATQAQKTWLSAFVILKSNEDGTTPDDIQKKLQQTLPYYMVPDRIELCDDIPLTSSGKVNYQDLLARSQSVEKPETKKFIKNKIESSLSEVWKSILGEVPSSGADNFFLGGGDSIKAFHFCAAAKNMGLHLTVKDVLFGRTLSGIASRVKVSQNSKKKTSDQLGSISLSRNQQAFLDLSRPNPHDWFCSWTSEFEGPFDPRKFNEALNDVLIEATAFKSRFKKKDGSWICALEASLGVQVDDIAILTNTLSSATSSVADAWVSLVSAELNLYEGPLLRVGYLTDEVLNISKVTWVAHHLVADPVSLQVLSTQVSRSYHGGGISGFEQNYRYWVEYDKHDKVRHFPSINMTDTASEYVCELKGNLAAELREKLASQQKLAPVLYACLFQALAMHFDVSKFSICIEHNGRYNLNDSEEFSTTIGWLTRYVTFSHGNSRNITTAELVHLLDKKDGQTLVHLPEIALNYFGDLQSAPIGNGTELMFDEPSVINVRGILFNLEIIIWLQGNRVCLCFRYLSSLLTKDDLHSITEKFSTLITHYLGDVNEHDESSISQANIDRIQHLMKSRK